VDSPYIEQITTPSINPADAGGKGAPADPSASGLAQGLENNSAIPLRNEMSFYGPDYSRNFYAPHADVPDKAIANGFKHDKAASAKKADGIRYPIEGPSRAVWDASLAKGDSREEALEKVRTFQAEEDAKAKQGSLKKADGALSLFKGLSLADPEPNVPEDEEHPQATMDETVGDAEVGNYNDAVKDGPNDQDEAYKNLDHFLKGVVGGYAAQLIAAFEATSKPLHFDAPFSDKLDLGEVIKLHPESPDSGDAAVAQFKAAMDSMDDDQKKMLLNSAVAQAAVWCANTDGAGGYNYEVFVRADSLDELSLNIVVVTGKR
jgi:hypothetical protein